MAWNCPTAWSSDRTTLTDTYGKFTAEPFERGFGVTVGNSLRRILLSSLEGSAVTRVKIQGVQHEITTIPGVVEDVTDIILNVKSLVVKNPSEQTKTIRIDRHERGVVKGADIIADEAVADHQPRAHHRHADRRRAVRGRDDASRTAAATARPTRTPARNARSASSRSIRSFSPVVRVKYEIEDTRVGQRTNYDKLVMEIWTNGTVTPQMALVEGAKILRKHLNPFIQYAEPGPEIAHRRRRRSRRSAATRSITSWNAS